MVKLSSVLDYVDKNKIKINTNAQLKLISETCRIKKQRPDE